MARILARAAAMQMVYEQMLGGDGENTLDGLIDFTAEKAGSAEAYEEDTALIRRLVEGVREHAEELDGVISSYLRGWTLDRIARVDLCVLRLAIYSLQHEKDIAPSIIIKEAVDMAGRYSTEKSESFVNGILSAYLKDQNGAAEA